MKAIQPDSPLRVAVLGAGYIGGALAAAGATSGHAVWAARRSVPDPATVPAGVHTLSGNITFDAIDGMPDALDVVELTIAPSVGDVYARTYAPAAAAALALSVPTDARALIYTSSTGVYGGRDGVWVTEESPRHGACEENAALIGAEDVLLDATRAECRGRITVPRGRHRSVAGARARRGSVDTRLWQ